MIRSNSENVSAAFDTLLEEIEVALRDINKAGADGFEAQNYDMAHRALEYARSAMVLREQVFLLRKEWQKLDTAFHTGKAEGTAKAFVANPPIRKRSLSSKANIPALPETPAPIGRLIAGRI